MTVTTYKLHSAYGEVFGWTFPLGHGKYLSATHHEETNYEPADGRIPRQIYKKHTQRGAFYSSHIHSGKHVHLNHAITSKLNRSGYVSCVD